MYSVNMLTLSQYAERKGLSRQRIHKLLTQRRIPGAKKVKSPGVKGGYLWMIPPTAKIG